jgi:hypothetical protein
MPLGAHHALSQAHHNDDSSTIELVPVDDPTKRHAILSNKKGIEQYFPAEDAVGIKIRNKLHRYKLDLATTSSTEMLPAITMNDYSLMFVRVFDPEKTGGLAAVTVSWPKEWSDYQALTYYRIEKGKVVTKRYDKWEGQILRATADGELLVLLRGAESKLLFMKDHQTVREVKLDKLVPPLAINLEGTRIAMRPEPNSEIVMYDDNGTELWRKMLWGASTQMFTPSGARLIVAAPGGIVALDAATGDVVTKECGFNFGVHDKAPEFATHGFASVCEDSIVQ